MIGLTHSHINVTWKKNLLHKAVQLNSTFYHTPHHTFAQRCIDEYTLLARSTNELEDMLSHELKIKKVSIKVLNQSLILLSDNDSYSGNEFEKPKYSIGNTRQLKNVTVYYEDKPYTVRRFLKEIVGSPSIKNLKDLNELLARCGVAILVEDAKQLASAYFSAITFYFICNLKLYAVAGTELYYLETEASDLSRVSMLGMPDVFKLRLAHFDYHIGELTSRNVLTTSVFRHLLLTEDYFNHILADSGYVNSQGGGVSLGKHLQLAGKSRGLINFDKFSGFSSTIISTENVILLARRVSKRSKEHRCIPIF